MPIQSDDLISRELKSIDLRDARNAKMIVEAKIARLLNEYSARFDLEIVDVRHFALQEYGQILSTSHRVEIVAVRPFEGGVI